MPPPSFDFPALQVTATFEARVPRPPELTLEQLEEKVRAAGNEIVRVDREGDYLVIAQDKTTIPLPAPE